MPKIPFYMRKVKLRSKNSGAQNYLQLGLYKVSLDDALKCIEVDKNNKNVINIIIFFIYYSHKEKYSNNFMYFKNSSKLKRAAKRIFLLMGNSYH